MTTLNTRNFQTGLQAFAAAVQARSLDLTDFQPGAILRAVAEAEQANTLWLQGLVTQVLAATRLGTSFGTDVDTFTVQFMPALPNTVTTATPNGSPRIQANPATGLVTFSRFTAFATAPFVPVGSSVKTTDGTQTFLVYADTTNANYSAVLNGYTMPPSVATLVCPVQAVNNGTAGNVAAGTISLITSNLQGIDTVTNSAAFTNGVIAETDAALKLRFQAFIASLSKATEGAIRFALTSLQANLQVAIHEAVDPGGGVDYGMVTIYIDDGSGATPSAVVTAANAAVGAVIAAGVRYGVYAASTLGATIVMVITTATGYVHATVVAQVAAAVGAFVNSTGLENILHYSQLAAIAYGVAGVTNVTGVTLNGGVSDLTPSAGQTIKSTSVVVS